WNFGDGSFGTGPRPTHTYASQGSYAVTLVVMDARGAMSDPVATTVSVGSRDQHAASMVTAGNKYTCAVRSTGVVECWGLDTNGQAPGEKSAASGRYVQVHGHKDHTCALRDDGVVECWGLKDF